MTTRPLAKKQVLSTTKNLGRSLWVVACLSLTSACSPDSPIKTAPVENQQAMVQTAAVQQEAFNPIVDILFVMDNSMSMLDDQERVSANIDRFAAGFASNEILDFHVGVVSVFDSKRFGSVVTNFIPNGQFRPVQGSKTPSNETFISRTPDFIDLLKATLKIGVQGTDLGGPEFEESFSPVVAALSPEMQAGANKGFYRPEAQLAIIMITDANDESPNLTPSQLDYFLRKLKNGNRNRISTYAVLSPAKENCAKDPGGAPFKIEEFLNLNGGAEYSLCDPHFGDRLADIGADIRRKSLTHTFQLNARPEEGTVTVHYGDQLIPQGDQGWTYDPEQVAIILHGDVQLNEKEAKNGANIRIDFMPVDLRNLRNGRAHRI